jgi:integrase
MAARRRVIEILSIRWGDRNFDASTVYLADTKNGEPRTVPLSVYITETLEAIFEGVPKALSSN